MRALPPGTWLQLMYVRERLSRLTPGNFIEIGAGAGDITELLLQHGWRGTVYDLEASTVEHLRQRFAAEIAAGKLAVNHGNYLDDAAKEDADLILSCMVMEHLTDAEQARYMERSQAHLRQGGTLIGLVPAGMRYWGIEDEIAGHCRRYEREGLSQILAQHGWRLRHAAGLTFPVSNLLLPLSNFLVRRAESAKLVLSELERTKLSGRRHVAYKTEFPAALALLLNPVTLRPLHWLQKRFGNSRRAMILYFEADHA